MIIATAGHVDHGKTSLVKQLTGVDTDTLEEEQRRGLSINLGFAYHYTEDNICLGFIDVPGHARFINTMISGVRGIDLGMLVVAADDGVMPQTREHLAVLRLLGVDNFLIVITKTDLVEPGRVGTVEEQVTDLLLSSGITEAPCMQVSNYSTEGIPDLRNLLEQGARKIVAEAGVGVFRMSVDRAFNLKGTGLVVTGTITSGRVTVGDTLHWTPSGNAVKIRGLHVQDRPAESAFTGDRCAINLSGGMELASIHRGDWLQGEGAVPSTTRCDARVELLADASCSLRHLSPVSVNIDARQVRAKLYLLELDQEKASRTINAGDQKLAQLIFDEPVLLSAAQRFLIRDDSQQYTLGGGVVLDPYAPRWGKVRTQRRQYLKAMARGTLPAMLEAWLFDEKQCIESGHLGASWNIQPQELDTLLVEPSFSERVERINHRELEYLVSAETWLSIVEGVRQNLEKWQRENPASPGLDRREFKQKLCRDFAPELLEPALEHLATKGDIDVSGGLLSISGHRVTMPPEYQEDWGRVLQELQRCGIRIPLLSELCAATQVQPAQMVGIMRQAMLTGDIHRISEKRFALRESLSSLAAAFLSLAEGDEEVSVVAYRDRLGAGRNFAIEVLEYFDKVGFTLRRDNARVVRDAGAAIKLFGLQR